MKFTYKKYRNIQWSAHDHHFGEISLFAGKLIIFFGQLSLFVATVLTSGIITGKYILPFLQKILE